MKNNMGFNEVHEIVTILPLEREKLEDIFDILQAEIEKKVGVRLIGFLFFESSAATYNGAIRRDDNEIYLYGTSLKRSDFRQGILEVEFYFSTNGEKIYQVLLEYISENNLPILN